MDGFICIFQKNVWWKWLSYDNYDVIEWKFIITLKMNKFKEIFSNFIIAKVESANGFLTVFVNYVVQNA